MEKNEFTGALNRKNSDTATNRVCCENCGKEIQENVRFCQYCGAPVEKKEQKKFCTQCGEVVNENESFCAMCGTPILHASHSQAPQKEVSATVSSLTNNPVIGYFLTPKKSLPAFIVGLIGSVLGMFGGICTTMCSCGSASNSAFLLIFVGAVIALLGSCMCLNKARIGSLCQVVGTLMIIIRAYSGGAEFFTIFSFVFLIVASLIAIVSAHLLDLLKKK